MCSTSWLDHVMKSLWVNVANFRILYGTTFCNNITLYFEYPVCTYPNTNEVNINHETDEFLVKSWNHMSGEYLRFYYEGLDFLSEDFLSGTISCKDISWSENGYTCDLDESYDFVVRSMRFASTKFSELSAAFENIQVTWWKELCKDTFQLAHQALVDWKINGKREQVKSLKLWRLRDLVLTAQWDIVKLIKEKLKTCYYIRLLSKDLNKSYGSALSKWFQQTNVHTCIKGLNNENDIAELLSEMTPRWLRLSNL